MNLSFCGRAFLIFNDVDYTLWTEYSRIAKFLHWHRVSGCGSPAFSVHSWCIRRCNLL